MSLKVSKLNEADFDRWDAYVLTHPQGSFFHRAGWKNVLEDSFQHRGWYFFAERDGDICGVLPLVHIKSALFGSRLVANAFCVDGAPIADDPEIQDLLDKHAIALLAKTGADYIEYRNPKHVGSDWRKREGLYANFARPIKADADEDLKQIPRKQRAVVRKALKTDLSYRLERNEEAFYKLYSRTMRSHGTPVFSRQFIQNLLRQFPDDCDILTVHDDGRAVSSVLNFYFRDQVLPYYTGALPEARRSGAADLMYWHLMREAQERGYGVFDFGRSKLDTGPFAFKKNWGFTPEPISLSFYTKESSPLPEVNPNNPKYKLMISLWQRLPLGIANTIGPIISRQLG